MKRRRKWTSEEKAQVVLSVLDRLCFVETSGMGALTYEPEAGVDVSSVVHKSLDDIADKIAQFQADEGERY